MLDQQVIDEIVRLLADDTLSHRKIAKQLGVSRAIVGSIASGRRGTFGRSNEAPTDDDMPQVARCPECGVRVFLPCVACRAREYSRRIKRRQSPSVESHNARDVGDGGQAPAAWVA